MYYSMALQMFVEKTAYTTVVQFGQYEKRLKSSAKNPTIIIETNEHLAGSLHISKTTPLTVCLTPSLSLSLSLSLPFPLSLYLSLSLYVSLCLSFSPCILSSKRCQFVGATSANPCAFTHWSLRLRLTWLA